MPLYQRTSSPDAGRHHLRGFTLIEMVMVIVIMGVIGGVMSVFMKSPVNAYMDSARRAALSDSADTLVRRMARDIRKSLPNSIRIPTNQCIEYIPTKTGGRYRAEELTAGDNSSLNFNVADFKFNILGSNIELPVNQRIAIGDVIAVYNLGTTGSNAYEQDNTAVVTLAPTESAAPVETTLTIEGTPIGTPLGAASGKQFPMASASNKFQVIPANENIVAYVCSGGNLHRTSRSLFPSVTSFPASSCPATGPIHAQNVVCNFDYSGSDLQRNALISMFIQLTEGGESVSLHHNVHVNNTP